MTTRTNSVFNTMLDRLVRPDVHIAGRSRSVFHLCGYMGLTLALVLTMTLVVQQGLSPWVMAALMLSAMATFLALAMVTKIITGTEELVYYHHEIAIMVVAALLLWVLGQPIFRFLEVTLLGVGIFLVCGRIGCLMVGCCHGRPSRWGVCYRPAHAAAGFTSYYVGVRLFPIQAVESLWVFGIVLVGSVFVLSGRPPGEALVWYVIMYDLGRFCFEFVRGDPERPYYGGFSEAQWISLALMIVVVGAELAGVVVFHPWHLGVTVLLVLLMIGVALTRRWRGTMRYRLLHPLHVKEVADVVGRITTLAAEDVARSKAPIAPAPVQVGCTSLRVQISGGAIRHQAGPVDHYALSCRDGAMTEEAAETLAGLILQLKHFSGSYELVGRSSGVFHLLLPRAPHAQEPGGLP